MQKLWTIDELADHLTLSVKSIYNLRASGDASKLPPAVKIGGKLRWRPEDVDAWVQANSEATSNVVALSSRRSA